MEQIGQLVEALRAKLARQQNAAARTGQQLKQLEELLQEGKTRLTVEKKTGPK